jgi:hypothetical protein
MLSYCESRIIQGAQCGALLRFVAFLNGNQLSAQRRVRIRGVSEAMFGAPIPALHSRQTTDAIAKRSGIRLWPRFNTKALGCARPACPDAVVAGSDLVVRLSGARRRGTATTSDANADAHGRETRRQHQKSRGLWGCSNRTLTVRGRVWRRPGSIRIAWRRRPV